MIKLKDLITERVDFHQIATELVKKYKLKSKVKPEVVWLLSN